MMLYAGAMSRWTRVMIVTMLAAVLAIFIASRGLLVAEHNDDNVVRVFYSTSEYPMSRSARSLTHASCLIPALSIYRRFRCLAITTEPRTNIVVVSSCFGEENGPC
jgi:hypothetical protein